MRVLTNSPANVHKSIKSIYEELSPKLVKAVRALPTLIKTEVHPISFNREFSKPNPSLNRLAKAKESLELETRKTVKKILTTPSRGFSNKNKMLFVKSVQNSFKKCEHATAM